MNLPFTGWTWKLKPIEGFRFLRKENLSQLSLKHGGGQEAVYM